MAGEGHVNNILGSKTSNDVTDCDIHMSNKQQRKIPGNNRVLVSFTLIDVITHMVKLLELKPNPYVET